MSDILKISFVESSGLIHKVNAPIGHSLLEVAHDNGIDIEGACEGSMACSTCHVIVDHSWYDKLPSSSEEENDMLDLAPGLTSTSRLGCQINITEDLDGLIVSLPKETYNWQDN